MLKVTLAALSAVLLLSNAAEAQRPGGRRPELERRFEQRMGALLKERLGLSDDQAVKLRDFSVRAEPRRRALMTEDRQVRLELREALGDSTAAQDVVGSLLDRSLKVQRDRVQLMEEDNRELATFLTPVQRARYFGLIEQVTRRMQDLREQREQGPGGGDSGMRRRPPARRPPGTP